MDALNRPRELLRLLRPRQWIKNVFVLAGLLFGRAWDEPALVEAALLAFAAFSLAASSMYVLNDWLDREADRKHPKKQHRPLARGTVSPAAAAALGLACALGAAALALAAGPGVLACVGLYAVLNLAYSAALKHVVVVDVFIISAGFMLRLLAGTWAIGIPPSNWLLLTGMFVTLFLGFAKRRAEWTEVLAAGADGEPARRRVIHLYSGTLLDKYLSSTATAALLCYGLYTVDRATVQLYGSAQLIWTLPPVIFAIYRYLYLLHAQGKGENPSRDVFTDPQILAAGLVWIVVFLQVVG
jgi:4-hydroxybenzoate polyprenyltransferase